MKKFSELEQWLFCTLFPVLLNAVSVALWLGMSSKGHISADGAVLSCGYLALSVLLALRALHLERLASSHA